MLAKMVTDVAEFTWNAQTQHFESRIYATDAAGKRQLVSLYATPPHVFFAAFAAQTDAILAFEADDSSAKVIDFKQHG